MRKLFTAEKILPSNLNGFSYVVRLICTQPSGGGADGRRGGTGCGLQGGANGFRGSGGAVTVLREW